ncbi:MAG: uroporphyrinogen-III synthase [Acidobacteria bacterium]|uniref:Uroporphyrinogen-III synthase n=1 Tax=Candidatus Polarisedimenticola svalbardensis TaxID=2886004 RepID=A0A8J6Y8L4_9BACT|nr:uroporphyrinogen-III synthase [Candidatus Polarisedimenticola svalbardensis]
MNVPTNPLAGRRILVTRPQERGERLLEQVAKAGGRIFHRPAIDFESPVDPSSADRAVSELSSFDWLVLTSPTGLRFFLDRLRDSGRAAVPGTVRFAVVGPGTADALQDAGYRPDLIPDIADADGLAAGLSGEPIAGKRVLWVRPETARPALGNILEEAGAEVVQAIFYRTVPHTGCPEIGADLTAGRYHGVLFTSPSTFRAVFEALPPDRIESFRKVVRVAIGRVTAGAMEAAGYPPHATAGEPTAEGVAAAFAAAFGPAPLC